MSSPVIITHHGRPRLVLSSVEIFDSQIKGGLERTENADHRASLLRGALNEMKEVFIAFDGQLRVVEANLAAAHFLGLSRDDLIARDIRDVLYRTESSALWGLIDRVIRYGEPADVNLGSLVREGAAVKAHIFPYDVGGAGMILKNLSLMDELQALQAREQAMLNAVRAMPSMAVISLNTRGGIEAVDEAFCLLTGFSETELLSLMIMELLQPSARAVFEKAFDLAIRDSAPTSTIVPISVARGALETVRIILSATRRENVADGVWAFIAQETGMVASA